MPYGGCSPYPSPYGGGEPLAQTILASLNQGMGTAYDPSPTTMVYAINQNIAREIAAGWATNQRLANQGNPRLLTTCLPRWERMLALKVSPDDSDVMRRSRVARHMARFGVTSTLSFVSDELTASLGDFFVALRFIDFEDAYITTPVTGDVSLNYPWGVQSATSPWSSTVAHILVQTQKPAGYTEGQFYNAAAEVFRILDPLVSSWITFDWYRNGEGHAAGSWPEDEEAGFYLDDESNLDNQIFDE